VANRSDFFSATLPRVLKRQLALQSFTDEHQRGEVKRLMIAAHAHEKRIKQKQLTSPAGRLSTEDDAEAANTAKG
jgi:hypothetical protein